jgi:hypothetical protein
MHNWVMGVFFKSYLKAGGANTYGNGGDASMWVNREAAEIQEVISN